MSLAVSWPYAVPPSTIPGYQLKPRGTVVRTDMDVGPARARRQASTAPIDVSIQLDLTLWQQMLLESWYREDAEEGGALFDVELLFPMGYVPVEARFKGEMVQAPVRGQHWQVTATLEVLDRPMLDADELQALLGEDLDAPLALPASLPLPVFDGTRLQPKPAVARSEVESGTPSQRRRARQSVTGTPVQWHLTHAEASILEAWLFWRARDGAAWFAATLLGGLGLIVCEARLGGELTMAPRSVDYWVFSATLELRERPMLTAAELAILRDEDADALSLTVRRYHHLVNFEFPLEAP